MRLIRNMQIETERLLLRQLTISDAPELFRSVGDSDVMRYWAPGPDESVHDTNRRITEIANHWKSYGFGDWGIVEKVSGSLIGFSGLHYIADMAEVNLGYAIEKQKWQKGFGFETCQAVLDYGFRRLTLPKIAAVIHPDNQASIHLARKCGLRFWKTFNWTGHERIAYEISLEEFLKRP